MSLIPVFEIGIWNAWIFMISYISLPYVMMLLNRSAYNKTDVNPPHKQGGKKALYFYEGSLVLALAYSIFLPLQLGTAWFYSGLAVFILGIAVCVIVWAYYASTPHSEPVTTGLNRYSRHPMYLGLFLVFTGIGVASASWVFLLLSLARTVSSFILAFPEERYCLERYGDTYQEYVNRTPRWIGLPKVSD